MKQIIFWSFISILAFCSCKQNGKNVNTTETSAVIMPPVVDGGILTSIDTARLTLVDSMVYTIDTTGNKPGNDITFNPNIYSEKDNIRYFKMDGELRRMVVNYFMDDKNKETRSVFYWKDGKPLFVRHREWHKFPNPKPLSMEVLTFFEDGKVVAVVDRETALQPNEPPSALYPVPLQISKRSLEDVVKEYSQYRDPALKALEEFEKNGVQKVDTLK